MNLQFELNMKFLGYVMVTERSDTSASFLAGGTIVVLAWFDTFIATVTLSFWNDVPSKAGGRRHR